MIASDFATTVAGKVLDFDAGHRFSFGISLGRRVDVCQRLVLDRRIMKLDLIALAIPRVLMTEQE